MTVNTRSRHPRTMIILLTCAFENSLHTVNGLLNAGKYKSTETVRESHWSIKFNPKN